MNIFLSFIGRSDKESIEGVSERFGPVATMLQKHGQQFDKIYLLLDGSLLASWKPCSDIMIKEFYKRVFWKDIIVTPISEITNPTSHQQIYDALSWLFNDIKQRHPKDDLRYFFNLSSGTPTMHAILMLFGKASYGAVMYLSYLREGKELVEEVDIPFPISFDTVAREISQEAGIRREAIQKEATSSIIGKHHLVLKAIAQTAKYAICDYNVMITGESGTGKELFARYYQQANRGRSKEPFICENCANFPENLIESELFGHEKGAFTGADMAKIGSFKRADKGVLFLDEIGEMPVFLQARLLRVLETGVIRPLGSQKTIKVDVRVVAATNNPEKLRPDLLYRLADGIIHLPPLRERGDDVIEIAETVLTSTNSFLSARLLGIAPYHPKCFDESAKKLLTTSKWLGNVRELISVVRRACALESETIITDTILQKYMLGSVHVDRPKITLPLDPATEVILNQPVDLMQQIKQIKELILRSKLHAFKTKREMAEFFGFHSDSALNKHL